MDYHAASIACVNDPSAYCQNNRPSPAISTLYNCVYDTRFLPACLDQLRTTKYPGFTDAEDSRVNQIQHFYPSGYYTAVGLLTRNADNLEELTMWVRVINSGVFAIVIYWATSILRERTALRLLCVTLALMFPLTAHTISSINPSSWAISGLIGVSASLISFDERTSRLGRSGGLLFTSLLLCAVSRVDSVLTVIFIGIYFLLLKIGKGDEGSGVRKRSTRGFVVPATVALIGLIALLYLRQTTTQSRSLDQEIVPGVGWGTSLDLLSNVLNFPQLFLAIVGIGLDRHEGWRNLAYLGRFQIPVPTILNLLILVGLIFSAALQFRLASGVRTLRRFLNSRLLLNGMLLALIMAPYLVALQRSGFRVGSWIQPRYVIPGFIAFCISAIVPITDKQPAKFATTHSSSQENRGSRKPIFTGTFIVAVMLMNVINLRAASLHYTPPYVDLADNGGLLGGIVLIFKVIGLTTTAAIASLLGLAAFLYGRKTRLTKIC